MIHISMVHAGSRTHSRSRSHPVAISRSITFPFGDIDGFLTIIVIRNAHGLAVLRSSKAEHSVVEGVPLRVGAATSASPGPIHIIHIHSHAAIAHVHTISTSHAVTVSTSHSAAHAVTTARAHSRAGSHTITIAHTIARAPM